MIGERSEETARVPMDQIRQLTLEHKQLEDRLVELDRNVYLTPDEQYERKRIQKLKLRTKDEIQRLKTGPPS